MIDNALDILCDCAGHLHASLLFPANTAGNIHYIQFGFGEEYLNKLICIEDMGLYKDTHKWPKISEKEIDRLAKVLPTHLRRMHLKMNSEERENFVKNLLKKQRGTCAFADGCAKYCWNSPGDSRLKHLKLQWGHKLPKKHGKKTDRLGNLLLQCARCNNQIQTSRKIEWLIPELEHKLKAIKKILLTKEPKKLDI